MSEPEQATPDALAGDPTRGPLTLQAAAAFYVFDLCREAGVTEMNKQEVVRRFGVARSHVYELVPRVHELLFGERPQPVPSDLRKDLENAVLRYRLQHAGCWVDGGRTVYSEDLRIFVLELYEREAAGKLTHEQFAAATAVPLPTLKDWWAGQRAATAGLPAAEQAQRAEPALAPPVSQPAVAAAGATESALEPTCSTPAPERPEAELPAPAAERDPLRFSLELTRILHEYDQWSGTLTGFIRHLHGLGLRYGKTFVIGLLYLAASRQMLHRPPPKPMARGSTFRPSPGLQWSSDGKEVKVVVDDRTFTITWQPMVDIGSTATVGSTVRGAEDTTGVLGSFAEGVATTGAAAPFVLLDHKACNKSAPLLAALPKGTVLMHGTLGRGQSKAIIEGQFGLFAQELGSLIAVVDTSSPEQIALSVAHAVTRAYSQGRNHRPRRSDGRTPYELFRDADASPEEVAAQVERLRAIKERLDARAAAEAARCDPRFRATVEAAFTRFGFTDDGDVGASLMRLSLQAVQNAIAIYAAKRDAGTLKPDAGLRYFAGIARNCQSEIDLRLIEEHLVDQLARTGDLLRSYLERRAASYRERLDTVPRALALVHEFLHTTEPAAQVFWRQELQRLADSVPLALRAPLRSLLCRRIRRTFDAPGKHRQSLVLLVVRAFTPEGPASLRASPDLPAPAHLPSSIPEDQRA